MKKLYLNIICFFLVFIAFTNTCYAETRTGVTPKPAVKSFSALSTESPAIETISEQGENSENGIDYSLIESSPFYNYDKFEKDWYIYASFLNETNTFGLSIRYCKSDLEERITPELRIVALNADSQYMTDISEAQILLDDTVYCFENLSPYKGEDYYFHYSKEGSILRTFLRVLPVSI